MVHLLILLALLLPLFSRPALAQDDSNPADAETRKELLKKWESLTPEEQEEKRRLYEKRFKVLSEKERKRCRDLWEKRLKGKTPAEREELKNKLEEVKKLGDAAGLKRRRDRFLGIEERFLKELPLETRAKLEAHPREKRDGLMRWALGRMFKVGYERFKESLTVEERKRLDRQHGPGRIRIIHEIEKERALAGMPEEERARIATLPKPARLEEERKAVHRARDEWAAQIRKLVVVDFIELLNLPPEELEHRLALSRLKQKLRHLGVRDRKLTEGLEKLPPKKLRKLIEEVEKIPRSASRDKRRRAAEALLTRFGR